LTINEDDLTNFKLLVFEFLLLQILVYIPNYNSKIDLQDVKTLYDAGEGG
jgi:hypothetical protein